MAKEVLIIYVSGTATDLAISCITLGWMVSGPGDLFIFYLFFDNKVFCYINIEEWFFEISILKEWHVSCVLFYCEDTAEIV